ncbi:CLUMA_CG012341, isoform A [Clunio marinus]|uniref:CLUMA_CG012341, isoform A n=1 Tax=Clunio marinus TaxID=568069 RepID=A0A1J1IK33_9DIPT|nr:CLUMA_CG012341, isoform A [Clunio marinus]
MCLPEWHQSLDGILENENDVKTFRFIFLRTSLTPINNEKKFKNLNEAGAKELVRHSNKT